MYKTVYDLTKEEMNELKESLFWEEGSDEILDGINFPWEIPDSLIYSHYDGIVFVDEDFFCNI